jgi:hypothetical protein
MADTARIYWPHLADAILEIREYTKNNDNFAFLQARHPITLNASTYEENRLAHQNIASWKFIAGGSAELDMDQDKMIWDVRLEALKDLSAGLEKQGGMRLMWKQWNGSLFLDQPLEDLPAKETGKGIGGGMAKMFAMGKAKSQVFRRH